MKFSFKQPCVFEEKKLNQSDLRQRLTLTLGYHKSSYTHLFDYMYQLSPHRLKKFLGNLQFKHFPIQKQRYQI